MKPNDKISKYVSYREVTYSPIAVKHGIDNRPNEKQLENIKKAAEKVFDPLREWVGGPIMITSCFRSAKLNEIIGNASNSSQHLANNGAAFDIDDTYKYKTNKEMFFYIWENLDFDQLIWEFGDDNNPDWVHFSYNEGKNRKEVLRAINVKGKTKYIKVNKGDIKK